MEQIKVELKKVEGKWVIVISVFAVALIAAGLLLRGNSSVLATISQYFK